MKNKLIESIKSATNEDIMAINNAYCDACNISDGYIYHNDEEFFEMFYPNAGDGLRVAQDVFYGDYNYSHDFVRFNGYGNLDSMPYLSADNLCELVENIADQILKEPSDFEHISLISEIVN